MKILITGGAGFIGSAVIRHVLRHTGASVINVDKLTYAGNMESLREVGDDPRHVFMHVNIGDRAALDRVFRDHQPDAVLHLAAESHVDRSIDAPAAFIETNIVGTYTLLEAARAYWQHLPGERRAAFRFHHVSTDEVYGDLDGMTARASEAAPYAPNSPYSASKASADHMVRAWQRTYGLPVLMTHCSNNYGPCQFPEKLIPLMILNALEGKPLPVYGDGGQVRDWLYVDDHARALLEVLTRGAVGETWAIGGHNEKTTLEVVRALCTLLDEFRPQGAPHARLITHVQDRPGHDRRYAIDAGKIQRELGWVPQETFATGLRKTVMWYLDNLGWCRHVQDGSYQRTRLGLHTPGRALQ